jgi:hypothetical protein
MTGGVLLAVVLSLLLLVPATVAQAGEQEEETEVIEPTASNEPVLRPAIPPGTYKGDFDEAIILESFLIDRPRVMENSITLAVGTDGAVIGDYRIRETGSVEDCPGATMTVTGSIGPSPAVGVLPQTLEVTGQYAYQDTVGYYSDPDEPEVQTYCTEPQPSLTDSLDGALTISSYEDGTIRGMLMEWLAFSAESPSQVAAAATDTSAAGTTAAAAAEPAEQAASDAASDVTAGGQADVTPDAEAQAELPPLDPRIGATVVGGPCNYDGVDCLQGNLDGGAGDPLPPAAQSSAAGPPEAAPPSDSPPAGKLKSKRRWAWLTKDHGVNKVRTTESGGKKIGKRLRTLKSGVWYQVQKNDKGLLIFFDENGKKILGVSLKGDQPALPIKYWKPDTDASQ